MKSLDTLNQIFKALSEPIRLRIVYLLLQRPSLCVCDLVDILGIGQSTVSRHLSYLKNATLVTAYREGTWMHYRLIAENLDILDKATVETYLQATPEAQLDLKNLKSYETHPRNCEVK